MCGLSGVIVTKPELVDMQLVKAIFSLLMEQNDSRGGHSWGAWGSGIEPLKVMGQYSTDYLSLHKHLEEFKFEIGGNPTFLFGHTRFGTHGTKTVENAHPFTVGNLTLAHNGVVDVYGYDAEDHSVDSGRIALAIVEHGWKDGMAMVRGSCALLVSVDKTPMIYRHNQVLNYATFPWGTVICSAEFDLKKVLIKRLGLVPIDIKVVPENMFCQPGWGEIVDYCPAQEAKSCTPNDRHILLEEEDYYSRYDTHRTWNDTERRWVEQSHVGEVFGRNPVSGLYEWFKKRAVETLGWSGDSGLAKVDTMRPTKQKRSKRKKAARRETISLNKDVPSSSEEFPDFTDVCETCGESFSIEDLSRCLVEWDDHDILMCTECIMFEVSRVHRVNVIGGYGQLVEVSNDKLSEVDREQLDNYLKTIGSKDV